MPVPFGQTHRIIPFKRMPTDVANIRKWDGSYKVRAKNFPTAAICEFIDGPFLGSPVGPEPLLISEADKRYIFGRSPNTRNAPEMKDGE